LRRNIICITVIVSFIVVLSASCTIFFPLKPTALFPENGQNVYSESVILSWLGKGDNTLYDLYFGEDSKNMKLLISNTKKTSHNIDSKLKARKYYYWKIIAKYSSGASVESETYHFVYTGILPAVVFNPYPVSGSVAGENGYVDLYWSYNGKPDYFKVLIGTSPDTLTQIPVRIFENYFRIENILPGKKYYWCVKTYKNGCESVNNKTWNFNTSGKKQLLIIGISDYSLSSASNLDLTPNDANEIDIAFSQSAEEFGMNKIIGRVFKNDILNALSLYEGNTSSEDISYFYYAGHGGYDNYKKESYLYMSDGDKLYVHEIKDQMDKINGKKFLIIDACQSGGFTDISRTYSSDPTDNPKKFNESIYRIFFKGNSKRNTGEYYVLTAANTKQSSWENKTIKNGVFSFFILDGIGDVGLNNPNAEYDFTYQGDLNGDGKITLNEIYNYAKPLIVDFVKEISSGYYSQDIQVYPAESEFNVYLIK